MILCAMCVAPCWAADPLASLLACRDLIEVQLRLACFDRETATLARASATAIAAAATTRTSSSAASSTPSVTSEQKFGLSTSALAAQETAVAGAPAINEFRLRSRITAMSLGSGGSAIFTLENTQVWRQVEPDGGELLARLGDAVTISHGMLGSYWLVLKSGRGCKVSRLR
jgi:hypothetical protein